MTTKARSLTPPPEPPDVDALLEVFSKVVPDQYYAIVSTDKSFALFKGMAATWARVAEGGAQSIQARYHLPSAYQTHEPASSDRKASGQITLQRTEASDFAVLAEPGEMRIQGPGGRVYVNKEPAYWTPGDRSEKTVLFECEVPGFLGNLNWLADENGALELELFSVVNQDRDRANVGGSVLETTGNTTTVRDNGRPSLFSDQDKGLYLRVENSANPSNVGQMRKVVSFLDSKGEEHPAGSSLYPNRLGLHSLVERNATDVLVEDDSLTSFTSYWMESVSTSETFEPYPDPPAVDDALYLGSNLVFAGASLAFTASDASWAITWEYWDGAAWTAIPDVNDLTNQWGVDTGLAQDPRKISVSWVPPDDWATRTSPAGGSVQNYYVRARISALTSVTELPVVSRVTVHQHDPLLEEDSTLTWSIRDYESLGVEITEVGVIQGGRDNDLYILGRDRGMYQQEGETDDAFRKRITGLPDTISPNAVKRAVNKALAPYHLRGDAIDVGSGLTGMFMDVTPSLAPENVAAFDMYEPGDAEPTDPWILNLSAHEAYGFGIVLVPPIGFGDFGAFLDEGPVYYDETADTYTGPSFYGWADGYPVVGASVYSSIYSAVDKILGAGIEFTLVKDPSLAA